MTTDQQNLSVTSFVPCDIFCHSPFHYSSDDIKYIAKGNTDFDIVTKFWTPLQLYSDTVFKLSTQSVLYMYSKTILHCEEQYTIISHLT